MVSLGGLVREYIHPYTRQVGVLVLVYWFGISRHTYRECPFSMPWLVFSRSSFSSAGHCVREDDYSLWLRVIDL